MGTDFQLDQLVIDSAMEKREMEHKHATIQQRVSLFFILLLLDQRNKRKCGFSFFFHAGFDPEESSFLSITLAG